jgi:predicted ATPase
VTLTGAGGCGKTRLSLEVAMGLLGAFPDGVWFVDLAPITDDRLVSQTVLTALGVREAPGQTPLEALLPFLQGRVLLLVLDNCEHLVQACAELVDTLLRATTGLQVLATSRELLRVPGETAWRVPSLAVPDSAGLLDPARLVQCEAVRLLIDRIRLVQPQFVLNESTALAVGQVCSRLDGIPLAIELAAARGAAMAIQEVAARLDDRFHLLTGGSRVSLPRQRTLQATLDWSHKLLTPAERTLFRRLAVFAGGWSLDAAETVCADPPIERSEILEALTGLVDKSLVLMSEANGVARYGLLETIRQYGQQKQREAGEEARMRHRHAQWFVALVEQAAPHCNRPRRNTGWRAWSSNSTICAQRWPGARRTAAPRAATWASDSSTDCATCGATAANTPKAATGQSACSRRPEVRPVGFTRGYCIGPPSSRCSRATTTTPNSEPSRQCNWRTSLAMPNLKPTPWSR